MGSLNLPSRKVRLRLIGTAVAVLMLGVGIWSFTGWYGRHVTECGVDAKGPYAKVRVGSFLGRLGMHEGVIVGFTYDGHWYDSNGSRIEVPVFGSTTTFVRGTWPPRLINLNWDGGRKDDGRIRVEGRAVGGHWKNTSVALQRRWHIRPRFKPLVEPNDLSGLGCEVIAPTND